MPVKIPETFSIDRLDTPIGAALTDLYGDDVLDVDVKPNRGDALSKRFEEALRQAREEPITRPKRDFDWD